MSKRTDSTLQVAVLLCLSTALTSPAGAESTPLTVDLDDEAETTRPEATAIRPRRQLEPQRQRRHRRMALELAGVFAVGNRWYWRDNGKPNEVDWQLSHDLDAVRTKLGDDDGWRFDGNSFDINALGHPGFGMLTHVLARHNGYTLGETFLLSTLASGTWEVFLELAEYGSLNDMLSTSTAGVPLGEAAYQIANHLRETTYDVRAGVGTENGAAFGVVSASAELDRVPTVGAGTVHTGRKVRMSVAVASDDDGVRSVAGHARSNLVGHYRNRRDSSLFVGLSTEFTYRNHSQRDERVWDLLSRVAAGPTVDVELRRGEVTVAIGADLYLDFAMVKSQAFESWRAAHPAATVRNVMQDKQRPYYYAVGGSIDPRVEVAYRRVDLGAAVTASAFGSLDGHDRDQEMMTADAGMTDHDARAQAWIGYRCGDTALVLDGAVTRRGGSMGDAHATTDGRSAMVSVGYRR